MTSFVIFKDGAQKPFLDCSSMGSKDIGGKLFLVADGTEVEVTEKLIVADAQPLGDGTFTVLDVLEPNSVKLKRRQEFDARIAAEEAKAESDKRLAARVEADERSLADTAAARNGAVLKREPA